MKCSSIGCLSRRHQPRVSLRSVSLFVLSVAFLSTGVITTAQARSGLSGGTAEIWTSDAEYNGSGSTCTGCHSGIPRETQNSSATLSSTQNSYSFNIRSLINAPSTNIYWRYRLSDGPLSTQQTGNPVSIPLAPGVASQEFTYCAGVASPRKATCGTVTLNREAPPAEPGSIRFTESFKSINEFQSNLTIELERVGGSAGAATADLRVLGESANSSDYGTLSSSRVSWGNGQQGVRSVTLPIINDTAVEADEMFLVSIDSASIPTQSPVNLRVTILDDDEAAPPESPGQISLEQSVYDVLEGDSLALNILRNNGTDGSASVNIRLVPGSASPSSDYRRGGGRDPNDFNATFLFNDGQSISELPYVIDIVNDSANEGQETFTMELSGFAGASAGAITRAEIRIAASDAPGPVEPPVLPPVEPPVEPPVVPPIAEVVEVIGNIISWPDDGWYQVQSESDYRTVCEGGRSCEVADGSYLVINHSSGQRFPGIRVSGGGGTGGGGGTTGSTDGATGGGDVSAVTVDGNTILWPDDGWYQVQSEASYATVCEGGTSCNVADGSYVVINHSNGVRTPGVRVPAGDGGGGTGGGTGGDVGGGDTGGGSGVVGGITISGNRLSWPNDGWYQVQSEADFSTVCEGGQSCTVPDGTYVVINHSNGIRVSGIRVPQGGSGDGGGSGGDTGGGSGGGSGGGDSGGVRVDGSTISWPNDGWYQVQSESTFATVCEGGTSCDVPNGSYVVINHSTGVRTPGIVVTAASTPPTPPVSPPAVEGYAIPRVSGSAPVIDGIDDGDWPGGIEVAQRMASLNVNNVGLSFPPDSELGIWKALYDSEYLYLWVRTTLSDDSFRDDSPDAWNDDALNIFLDADRSRGTRYDGNDDHQLILRFDTSSSRSAGGRNFEYGDNSATSAIFDYATSQDDGTLGQFYEVRIDRRSIGLFSNDQPFGIEVQVDFDDGRGGNTTRDFRIGWHEPNGQDESWRNPSQMGTATLQP